MSTTTTTVYLYVPTTVNLSQFSDVQRGIIFIWFFTAFFVAVITAIRLISGQAELNHEKYQDKGQQPVATQSLQNFQHQVLRAQVPTQDDPGSVKLMKLTDRLNTMIMPVLTIFALNFVLGVTYAFSLILYFIVLVPVVLFNLAELHRRAFEHKAFVCIFQNLWLIATFFWFINIWVTGKYQQPYYMYQLTS